MTTTVTPNQALHLTRPAMSVSGLTQLAGCGPGT